MTFIFTRKFFTETKTRLSSLYQGELVIPPPLWIRTWWQILRWWVDGRSFFDINWRVSVDVEDEIVHVFDRLVSWFVLFDSAKWPGGAYFKGGRLGWLLLPESVFWVPIIRTIFIVQIFFNIYNCITKIKYVLYKNNLINLKFLRYKKDFKNVVIWPPFGERFYWSRRPVLEKLFMHDDHIIQRPFVHTVSYELFFTYSNCLSSYTRRKVVGAYDFMRSGLETPG